MPLNNIYHSINQLISKSIHQTRILITIQHTSTPPFLFPLPPLQLSDWQQGRMYTVAATVTTTVLTAKDGVAADPRLSRDRRDSHVSPRTPDVADDDREELALLVGKRVRQHLDGPQACMCVYVGVYVCPCVITQPVNTQSFYCHHQHHDHH